MKAGTRVLVVEDDASIARLLQLELEHRGFTVSVVRAGDQVLGAVDHFRPDVVILDILLPGIDGERVLGQMRRRGVLAPVIMLTARDRAWDKVRVLDLGADDYITKPFNIDELVARLRAVLRRVEPDDVVRVADLEINMSTRQVQRGTRTIDLTVREFDLLALLARNARRVVPHDVILDRLWMDSTSADPNIVHVYIGYLRRKIDLPDEPKLIYTVRGVGFSIREG